MTTKDVIRIQRGTFTMEGVGMIVDLATEQMKILKNVQAGGAL